MRDAALHVEAQAVAARSKGSGAGMPALKRLSSAVTVTGGRLDPICHAASWSRTVGSSSNSLYSLNVGHSRGVLGHGAVRLRGRRDVEE